jgi:hypothetical protein
MEWPRFPTSFAIGGALALAALGCGAPSASTNVIDAVLRDMLAAERLEPALEDDAVLCRRMAIDLTGVPPTAAEVGAQCLQRSPRQMATYFMEKPTAAHVPDGSAPYVWVNRRWWADSFQYQSTLNIGTTWYTYVRDLDLAVADLYGGKIAYDEFARRALGSPAFARRFGVFETRHDLTQLASQAYRVFLGREALPSEAADFGNLWRGWTTQHWEDLPSRALYADCPVLYQAGGKAGCEHFELGLDGSACAGGDQIACQSTVLGPAAVLPSSSGFVRWNDLLPDDLTALRVPGSLITARREFAEAAVDRALTKYLGWWKTAAFRPDSDVPAVRDALVRKLIADEYDVRKLELEIVTSLLYTQRAAIVPGRAEPSPIWASGPTKLLYAEAWLDSIALASGKPLGGCDFRFDDTSPGAYSDSILIRYPFAVAPGLGPSFYSGVAQNLGGCPVATAHGSAAGLVPAVTRRVALATLCPGAFPPAAGASLSTLVEMEYAGLGRPPTGEESSTWLRYLSDAKNGGCDPQDLSACGLQRLADQLCMSLFATAQFNYY